MYRSDIDGLRALAVIPVVLYHFDLGFPGGFVGVDVFFVISGFLITSLLIRDLEKSEFSLRKFWERRARRILPAVITVVLFSLVAGWFCLAPDDFRALGESAALQSVFASNFYFWSQSGYFSQPAELQPLLHTWSLAVEEQFYILFPILLCFGWRRGKQFCLFLLGAFMIGSFLVSVFGLRHFPDATFYLLPSRAWELLLGALLALVGGMKFKLKSRWQRELLGWSGIFAIMIPYWFYSSETSFPGTGALAPCLGAVAVIAAGNGRSLLSSILSMKWPVFIGLISYSLYLWHWPVVVFAKQLSTGDMGLFPRLTLVICCIGLAALSWKYIETPFRRKQILPNSLELGLASVGGLVAVIVLGLVIFGNNGVPGRFSDELQRIAEGRTDKDETLKDVHNLDADELRRNGLPVLNPGRPGSFPELVVWGDSHCGVILSAIRDLCRDHHIHARSASRDSTLPLLGTYKSSGPPERFIDFNQVVFDFIKSNSVKHVLLVGSWSHCINPARGAGQASSRSLLRSEDCDWKTQHSSEQAMEVFETAVRSTVQRLSECGVNVWIMKEVPSHEGIVPNVLAKAVMAGRNPCEVGVPIDIHSAQTAIVDEIFASLQVSGVRMLDPAPRLLNENGVFRASYQGAALYYDNSHLNVTGARFLKPLFAGIMEEIKPNANRFVAVETKEKTSDRQ